MALWRIALVSIKWIKREIEKEILWVMSISLTDAVADGLFELKAYGWTEQRNLPSGYTQLEYVYMTDNSYLVPNIIPEVDWHIEMDFQTITVSTAGVRSYFGGRYDNSAAGAWLRLGHTSSKKVVLYGFDTNNDYTGSTYNIANNTRYKYVYNNNSASLSTGGTVVDSTTYTPNDTTTAEVGINSYRNQNGSFASVTEGIYLYSFKAWNGQDELVMDLVPAKTSTEVGFYDMVSKTFNTATAWTFTAWPDTVPTPSAPMDIISNNGVLKAKHQSWLPLWYTLLDSVTWDGVVWIDTWLKLQAGDEIDMDYEWLWIGAWQSSDRFFFGTSNADTSKGWCRAELYTSNWTSAVWYARFSSLSSVNTQTDMSTQLTWHLTLKQESFTVNNVEILTPSYEWTFQDTTLTYFGRFNATGDTFVWAYIKISKFTLKNNWVYRYYGIPCKNSSNVIWMYDLVSWTFSTKVGTWTFTAGNTVSDPIEIYTDWTTETIEDDLSNTATAEMLLKVGDYADEQEILSWDITRNIWVKVLDGTETWRKTSSSSKYCSLTKTDTTGFPNAITTASDVVCTHAIGTGYNVQGYCSFGTGNFNFNYKDTANDLNDFKQFLADQYNAWTPVIIVYPLETPTTETVTGQTMNIPAWDSDITITQASINTLELSAKYKALPN